jgi:hypothetical protein
MTPRLTALLAACGMASLVACSGVGAHEERLLDRIRSSTSENSNAGLRSENAPASVPVEGVEAPGQVRVALRTSSIEKYPCTKCHDKPLAQLVARSSEDVKAGKKKAHWNIRLHHASAGVMNCNTCHGKGTMDELTTLAGETAGMNHSYRVCGQCHATQLKDWAGGAHGKRLSGWAPPRVVASCASCHDPHKPALESRWPAQRDPGRN